MLPFSFGASDKAQFQNFSLNQTTPAIVAQNAVRRLPRIALFLICLAYVVPGFVGRSPWKSADMASFGTMAELASGAASWFGPQLLGQATQFDALLPYWLGAAFIKLLPWIEPVLASRIPFALLLALTLAATWYGVYYLARTPQAQPVAFAFGGEAHPADYARAIADGGLLALIACLGLAQLSHETTPAVAQLAFASLAFYSVAALPFRRVLPLLGVSVGLLGLALSGAPTMAVLLGAGSAVICLATHAPDERSQALRWTLVILAVTFCTALLATLLDLWRWRISMPALSGGWREWRSLGRLLLWFTWPAWPLALWTLWRWRRQWQHRHLALPLWFAGVAVVATLTTYSADRSLLLALPALAALAAFALPTLKRSVAALIDWFTLLFFTGCAIVIWVVWISTQTGFPAKPAANLARLVPGYVPSFSLLAFVVALAATLAWAWLVKWRVGRHRKAIWKSLALPAGGAVLGWVLVMTLWLPPLDQARGYSVLTSRLMARVAGADCMQIYGLNRAQVAALRYHTPLQLLPASHDARCPWLLVDSEAQVTLPRDVDLQQWGLDAALRRPADKTDDLLLYRRIVR